MRAILWHVDHQAGTMTVLFPGNPHREVTVRISTPVTSRDEAIRAAMEQMDGCQAGPDRGRCGRFGAMSDPIEPALPAELWQRPPGNQLLAATIILEGGENDALGITDDDDDYYSLAGEARRDAVQARAAIALCNASLPDSDPRKITWEMVDDVNAAAGAVALFHASGFVHRADCDCLALSSRVSEVADILASHLPPRPAGTGPSAVADALQAQARAGSAPG